MRPLHSVTLSRMLLLFFMRRVMSGGALRSLPARIIASAAVTAMTAVFVGVSYVFLRALEMDKEAWDLLFAMATVSIVLWVQIVFLSTKVLFLNAQGIFELSFQLPLTNRERAVSFLMCEAVIVAAVTGVLSVGLVGASILLLGAGAVPRLFEAVILPAVLTYLVLGAVYQLLARTFARIIFGRIGGPAMILTMFTLLLAYATRLGAMTSETSRAYLERTDAAVWVTFLGWLSRHHGSAVMLLVFAGIAGVLVALTLWLTPNQPTRTSRYIKLTLDGWIFGYRPSGYDHALIRSSQTWLAAWLSLMLFAFLCIKPIVNPLWGLSILSIGGLYQYAATLPLRVMSGSYRSPWRVYGQLLRAQILLFVIFLVPGTIVVAFVNIDFLVESPFPIVGYLASAVLTQWIGVAFPAEDDNPFSVFVGLITSFSMLGVVGVGSVVLHLSVAVVVVCLVLVMGALVWYTVNGIRNNESRRRHETDIHSFQ